jgi:1-acyl-sn-glycerol-3-phosphate acyltransferase
MKGRTGALRVALETGAPLIPVAQWGAQEIMAPYSKRIDVSGRKLLQVAAGPAVDIDDLRGVPLTREHLEEGTERLMAAITALLAGIRGEQAPPQRLDWSARRRGPAGVRNEEDRWLGLQ